MPVESLSNIVGTTQGNVARLSDIAPEGASALQSSHEQTSAKPRTVEDSYRQLADETRANNQRFGQAYLQHGPRTVIQGARDVVQGNISKGLHDVISGAGITAAPIVLPELVAGLAAAPLATTGYLATGLGTGMAGQALASRGARALGATPDQAQLAGDVGGIAGSALAPTVAQGISTGIDVVGKGLYKGGVALLPKTLKQQFPTMGEAGYREGIPLTGKGADAAKAAGISGGQEADALIAEAQRQGVGPVSSRAVVSELRPVRDKVQRAAQLGLPNETSSVAGRARSFAAQNPKGIPLTRAQELKREAQDLAESAYRAQDRGATINQTDTLMNEAMAGGLRKELERLVPAVAPVNARTKELVGLEKGATHASQTGHILSRLGGSGVVGGLASLGGAVPAVAGAGAGLMLTTPGGLSQAALALKAIRPLPSHLENPIRAAILAQLLAGEQQDQ